MSGVTAVKQAKKEPSRLWPIIFGIAGLVALMNEKLAMGLTGIAVAIAWWLIQKPEYSVVLHTSSGEVRALKNKDRKFIDSVISALNQSIIYRG